MSLAPIDHQTSVGHYQPRPLDREQIELLKRTIAKGTTDDELALFVQTCNRSGLDPFARQIHAVKRWDKNAGREVMAIQVGIDGFRLIAERTGLFLGRASVEWCGKDGEWRDVWLDDNPPAAARVVVRKLVPHGQVAETSAVALYREYVQTNKTGAPNHMWSQMPANQLGKCAEAQALRAAFPAELSGLYTSDEMGAAGPSAALLPPEGWESHEASVDAHNETSQRIKTALTDEQRQAVRVWRDEQKLPWPMPADDLARLNGFIDELLGIITVDAESPFTDTASSEPPPDAGSDDASATDPSQAVDEWDGQALGVRIDELRPEFREIARATWKQMFGPVKPTDLPRDRLSDVLAMLGKIEEQQRTTFEARRRRANALMGEVGYKGDDRYDLIREALGLPDDADVSTKALSLDEMAAIEAKCAEMAAGIAAAKEAADAVTP